MAKNKHAAKTAAATPETVTDESLPTGEATVVEGTDAGEPTAPAEAAPKVSLAKMRGPRGVSESAIIAVKVEGNPKRPGSKAHAVFSCYDDGMTVGQFCDAVDATPNKGLATIAMVYDTAHGFIEIEGYKPPNGVIQPKPKAAPKPKAEKKAKTASKHEGDTATSPVATSEAAAAVAAAAAEEVMD